jgi:hypothetical protein
VWFEKVPFGEAPWWDDDESDKDDKDASYASQAINASYSVLNGFVDGMSEGVNMLAMPLVSDTPGGGGGGLKSKTRIKEPPPQWSFDQGQARPTTTTGKSQSAAEAKKEWSFEQAQGGPKLPPKQQQHQQQGEAVYDAKKVQKSNNKDDDARLVASKRDGSSQSAEEKKQLKVDQQSKFYTDESQDKAEQGRQGHVILRSTQFEHDLTPPPSAPPRDEVMDITINQGQKTSSSSSRSGLLDSMAAGYGLMEHAAAEMVIGGGVDLSHPRPSSPPSAQESLDEHEMQFPMFDSSGEIVESHMPPVRYNVALTYGGKEEESGHFMGRRRHIPEFNGSGIVLSMLNGDVRVKGLSGDILPVGLKIQPGDRLVRINDKV